MAKRLVIVNPASRRARHESFCSRLAREIRAQGGGYDIVTSRSAAHAGVLAREAAAQRYDAVVAVGGDGLVNHVARELVGSETALGIVPAGVGNDFARGVGLPLRLTEACRVVASGRVRALDVGSANGRYFFSVAVIGLAAEVNRRANRLRRFHLPKLYMLTTLATVFAYKPRCFTVSGDGHEGSYYGWMIAAGNTWSCAAGMALLPAARPDDALLDVCVIGALGRGQLLLAFPRVFLGSHVYHKGVEMMRVKSLAVSADAPCDLYADGERLGSLPVMLSVVPGALRVITPA